MSLIIKYTDELGREWRTFIVEYQTDGESFTVNIMALDYYHAVLMLEDLKATATVLGELDEVIEWN